MKMNKAEAYKFDKHFIEELVEHYHFGDFLRHRDNIHFWDWYESHIEDISFNFNVDIYAANGLTKVVFVIPESGTVIKIPYSDCKENYCEREYNNYKKSIEAGISQCFAWCDRLAVIEECPIYIMEYVNAGDTLIENTIRTDYPEIAEEHTWDIGDTDCIEEVLEAAWETEVFDTFESFSYEYHINDIHSGNIGRADRGIVLIDYSGFYG